VAARSYCIATLNSSTANLPEEVAPPHRIVVVHLDPQHARIQRVAPRDSNQEALLGPDRVVVVVYHIRLAFTQVWGVWWWGGGWGGGSVSQSRVYCL
jgi:hypothetical protein